LPSDLSIELPDEMLLNFEQELQRLWVLEPGALWVYPIPLNGQVVLENINMQLASTFTSYE